ISLLKALVRDRPDLPQYRAGLASTYRILGEAYKKAGRIQEVEQAWREAVRQSQALARDHPSVGRSAIEAAGMQIVLGNLLRDGGRPKEALAGYAGAAAVLRPVFAAGAKDRDTRERLREAHQRQAEARARLGRHAEALADWDRAIELDGDTGRPWLRLQRA